MSCKLRQRETVEQTNGGNEMLRTRRCRCLSLNMRTVKYIAPTPSSSSSTTFTKSSMIRNVLLQEASNEATCGRLHRVSASSVVFIFFSPHPWQVVCTPTEFTELRAIYMAIN